MEHLPKCLYPELDGLIQQEVTLADGETVVLFSKNPFTQDDLDIFRMTKKEVIIELLQEMGFIQERLPGNA